MISIATNLLVNFKLTNYQNNITHLLGQNGQFHPNLQIFHYQPDLTSDIRYRISSSQPFQLQFLVYGVENQIDYIIMLQRNRLQETYYFQVNRSVRNDGQIQFEVTEWDNQEYQAKKKLEFHQKLNENRRHQRLVWMNLHYLAHQILPANLTVYQQQILNQLVENLDNIRLTNCRKCQLHYRIFKNTYQTTSNEIVKNRTNFQQFLLDYHNHINQILGRAIFTLDQTQSDTDLMENSDLKIYDISLADKWNSLNLDKSQTSFWDCLFASENINPPKNQCSTSL